MFSKAETLRSGGQVQAPDFRDSSLEKITPVKALYVQPEVDWPNCSVGQEKQEGQTPDIYVRPDQSKDTTIHQFTEACVAYPYSLIS